jgi:hypothetical protein
MARGEAGSGWGSIPPTAHEPSPSLWTGRGIAGLVRLSGRQASRAGSFSPACWVLHCIALPVVSEWCQEAMDYASPVPLQIRFAAPMFFRSEWFGVGEAVFEYRGPGLVCRYFERLTEAGMTQALGTPRTFRASRTHPRPSPFGIALTYAIAHFLRLEQVPLNRR